MKNKNSNVVPFLRHKLPEGVGASGNLKRIEYVALEALTAYVAYNQEIDQSVVKDMVLSKFGVNSYHQIHRDVYEEAIIFLVEFSKTKIMMH